MSNLQNNVIFSPTAISNLDPKKQELLEARISGLYPRSPSVTSFATTTPTVQHAITTHDTLQDPKPREVPGFLEISQPSDEADEASRNNNSTLSMSIDSNIDIRSIESAIPVSHFQFSNTNNKENLDFRQIHFGSPMPPKSDARMEPTIDTSSITDVDSNDSTLRRKRQESKDAETIDKFLIRGGSTVIPRPTASFSSMLDRKNSTSNHGLASSPMTARLDKSPIRKIDEFFPTTKEGSLQDDVTAKLKRRRQVTTLQSPTTPSSTDEDISQRLALCEAENISLHADVKRLAQELHDSRSSFNELMQEQSDKERARMEHVRNIVKDVLTVQAVHLAKSIREKANSDCLRLAKLNIQRHGTEFRECWVDGTAFTELTERMDNIQLEKEDIERLRKQLLTRRKAKDDEQSDLDARNIKVHILDDVYKLRIASLKKEELELDNTLEKLTRDRDVHIKEIKRIRDEDQSPFNDHPTLQHGRYLLLNLLGKGGFSEVYRGFDLIEMRAVACKLHQLNPQWSETRKANYTRHAIREYRIHKRLHHANIVQLYDVFGIDNNTFCTVMEYIEGCDLNHYLQMNKILSEREAKSIIVQLLEALKYLNEIKPPVIHYDLKPANLLYHRGELFITDFGLSKEEIHADGTDLTSPGAGTYWYLPPECFDIHTNKITSKVDVWSAGVIFYQLLYGKKPFGDMQSQQSMLVEKTMLNASNVVFPVKPAVSPEAKVFMTACLQSRKELRPDVLTLCEHPYVKLKVRNCGNEVDKIVK